MPLTRRSTLIASAAAAVTSATAGTTETTATTMTPATEAPPLYGLIGKMKAAPGQRDALAAILLKGVAGMPGCLSYVVAQDPTDTDALWITEAWESRGHHQASLSLASVRTAIAQGRPLIAGFGVRFETLPLGGHGLVAVKATG